MEFRKVTVKDNLDCSMMDIIDVISPDLRSNQTIYCPCKGFSLNHTSPNLAHSVEWYNNKKE